MILRIMTVVPSKLRLDASTPRERPGRRWRRRMRVRAPIGAPCKILGIPYHEFLQECQSSPVSYTHLTLPTIYSV